MMLLFQLNLQVAPPAGGLLEHPGMTGGIKALDGGIRG